MNASITAGAWVSGVADLLDPSFVTNRCEWMLDKDVYFYSEMSRHKCFRGRGERESPEVGVSFLFPSIVGIAAKAESRRSRDTQIRKEVKNKAASTLFSLKY